MNNRDVTRSNLVVVVILAIAVIVLAFLLLRPIFPAPKAYELAKCTGNLRALCQAFFQYARDYDGYYPSADVSYAGFTDNANVFHDAGEGWFGLLCKDYCDGWIETFQCPAEPRGFQKDNISYGYNVYFAGRPDAPTSTPVTGGQIRRRSHTIMLADAKVYLIRPPSETNWPGQAPELRHSGKTNCLMADGHVEQLDLKELSLSGPNNWWTLKKLEE